MKARELIGYLIGLILFVILVPLIMWKFSGEVHPNAARLICLGVMAAAPIKEFSRSRKTGIINRNKAGYRMTFKVIVIQEEGSC